MLRVKAHRCGMSYQGKREGQKCSESRNNKRRQSPRFHPQDVPIESNKYIESKETKQDNEQLMTDRKTQYNADQDNESPRTRPIITPYPPNAKAKYLSPNISNSKIHHPRARLSILSHPRPGTTALCHIHLGA